MKEKHLAGLGGFMCTCYACASKATLWFSCLSLCRMPSLASLRPKEHLADCRIRMWV